VTTGQQVDAVVFDLLFTLVHPGLYPGGSDRVGWLASVLGLNADALEARWAVFELVLESGRAEGGPGGRPAELHWLTVSAGEMGRPVSPKELDLIAADWDLTRRQALAAPPAATIRVLRLLRDRGVKIGVLSNTHGLELRSWPDSPLASLVDAVALSHEIGVCKPEPASYADVLGRLGVPAARAAYVGDGSSGELEGARAAGFAVAILVEEAARRLAPHALPELRAQADICAATIEEVPHLLGVATS
jgi:FMN phosphatase YigB (HAD superfamily)